MPNLSPERLTEQEQKLVRRYYLLSNMAVPAMTSGILIPFELFLLMMIDEVFLCGQCPPFYILLFSAVALVMIVLFGVFLLVPTLEMRRKEWQLIQEKLTGSAATPARKQQIQHLGDIADRLGFQLPPVKIWTAITLWGPILICLLAFTPEMIHSHNDTQQKIALVSQTAEQIAQPFEAAGYQVIRPDLEWSAPKDYTVRCCTDNSTDDYLTIHLNSQGLVNELYFHTDVSDTSPEQNIQRMNRFIEESFSVFLSTDAPVAIPKQDRHIPMPETLPAPYLRKQDETVFNDMTISRYGKEIRLFFCYYYHEPDSCIPSAISYTIEDRTP